MLNVAKSYLEGHFDFHQSCKDAKAYQVKEITTISARRWGGEVGKGVGGGGIGCEFEKMEGHTA